MILKCFTNHGTNNGREEGEGERWKEGEERKKGKRERGREGGGYRWKEGAGRKVGERERGGGKVAKGRKEGREMYTIYIHTTCRREERAKGRMEEGREEDMGEKGKRKKEGVGEGCLP
jgi:hypothetical protein